MTRWASIAAMLWLAASCAWAQDASAVVDVPSRPGVTQRLLLSTPAGPPQAAAILFAGGHGGLQIFPNGSMKSLDSNFLVRMRQAFAAQGLLVAVIDAPSDRQAPPFLGGFRQRPEHAADVKAVIAWIRERHPQLPVWLVGTSRGTQSVAYIATELPLPDGPDGVVLTSSIFKDDKGRPVTAMPLGKIRVPVLVVHHEQDGCEHCLFADMPPLMDKLGRNPRHALLTFKGGQTRGDPCEAFGYHGYNGIEAEVVEKTAAWMLQKK